MIPVPFPGANYFFGAPPGMAESQVQTIPAAVVNVVGGNLDGAQAVITAWQPEEHDLERIKNGSPIYLISVGGLPPHQLTTELPKNDLNENQSSS